MSVCWLQLDFIQAVIFSDLELIVRENEPASPFCKNAIIWPLCQTMQLESAWKMILHSCNKDSNSIDHVLILYILSLSTFVSQISGL